MDRVRNVNGEMRVRASTSGKWRSRPPKSLAPRRSEGRHHRDQEGGRRRILVCAIWVNTNTICTEDRYNVNSDDRRDRWTTAIAMTSPWSSRSACRRA